MPIAESTKEKLEPSSHWGQPPSYDMGGKPKNGTIHALFFVRSDLQAPLPQRHPSWKGFGLALSRIPPENIVP
jgi:hypothetical protein